MSRLLGLVLCGGLSVRMGRDKGSLVYPRGGPGPDMDQRTRCKALLGTVCEAVFLSEREWDSERRVDAGADVIRDEFKGIGPAAGLLAAHRHAREAAWFVLACDLPWVAEVDILRLWNLRDAGADATAYALNPPAEGEAEPLFAIWEPTALRALAEDVNQGHCSPRRTLAGLRVARVTPRNAQVLANVNTPEEKSRFQFTPASIPAKR